MTIYPKRKWVDGEAAAGGVIVYPKRKWVDDEAAAGGVTVDPRGKKGWLKKII